MPSIKKFAAAVAFAALAAAVLAGCTRAEAPTQPSATTSTTSTTSPVPLTPREPVDDPAQRADLARRVEASMGRLAHFKSKRAGGMGDLVSRFDLTDPSAPLVESTTTTGYAIVLAKGQWFVKEPGASSFARVDQRPVLAEEFIGYPQEIAGFVSVEHLDSNQHDGKPSRHYLAQDRRGRIVELWLDEDDRVREYIIDSGSMHAVNLQLYDFDVPNAIEEPEA